MSKTDKSQPIEAKEIKEKHDSKLNIYQRMIEVQKIAHTVQKTDVVKMFENDKGYKAVTHDEVAKTLHLPLAQCGIFMLPDITEFSTTEFSVTKPGYQNQPGKEQKWYRTDIKILVKWINVDNPSDFIQSTGAAFALDTSDKSFAKAYSLALKIVLLKVHLLESRDGEEQRPFDEQNQDQRPQAQQKQGKAAAKKDDKPKEAQAPKDVVYPFESSIKGKKIGEVETATLEKARGWLKEQMALDPKPKNISQIAFIYAQVKAVLVDRNPPPPKDDIPENAGNVPNPEDEGQLFPPDDADPAPPTIDDFMIPKGVLEALDGIAGIPLKKISENELRAAQKVLDAEMAKGPKSKISAVAGFEIRNKITEFFQSMGV